MESKTMDNSEERIVMTPILKEKNHTILRLERVCAQQTESSLVDQTSTHVAGGHHSGIVINKQINTNGISLSEPQLCLAFKVFLINSATQTHTLENRQLSFWFSSDVTESETMLTAQDFFRSLVNPTNFPRDYVSFIMKLMKLMQHQYATIKQIEIDMKQIEEISQPPSRPMSIDESIIGAITELSDEKVLEIIESSYPNPIALSEIANATQATEEEVHFYMQRLLSKNLIKSLANGLFTRVTQNDTEVKLVRQMPKVVRSEQPTIAIITAQYCEKLAVDAMISNKDTYVRYKTEGESNVYTLGTIGNHRVVSTKLPAVGHSRCAMIAAGNTTTRLLGTFQRVDYVFLVGIGGGVPHYTDFNRHVRLGDVVVSVPPKLLENDTFDNNYIYVHCDKVKNSPEEPFNSPNKRKEFIENFNYRFWCPPCLELQNLAIDIHNKGNASENRVWEQYIEEGMDCLRAQDPTLERPSPQTDKLYMSIGTKDVIEMTHPSPPSGVIDPRTNAQPMIHFGAIGSGRMVVKDEQIRQDVAHKFGIKSYETDFDCVVESIFGNRKDKYIFLRGIADYRDGTRRKDWQSYSSICAAAFMKYIIENLSAADED